MRTKEEIINSMVAKKGESIEPVKLRVELCRLEVEIDKRDLLEEIRGELEEMNRLRRIH